ncbi:hypothetical protein [Sutcliffiella horikoshii]|nr:hypothetical protein [Sutcliffiella horikoshii]
MKKNQLNMTNADARNRGLNLLDAWLKDLTLKEKSNSNMKVGDVNEKHRR